MGLQQESSTMFLFAKHKPMQLCPLPDLCRGSTPLRPSSGQHCSIAPLLQDQERASPPLGAAHSVPEVVAVVVGAQGPELPDGREQDPSAVPAAAPADLVHSYREGFQRSSAQTSAHTSIPLGPADLSSAGAGLEEARLRHTPPQWFQSQTQASTSAASSPAR